MPLISFFFGSTGVWAQGFVLARQVLCHLSHTFFLESNFKQNSFFNDVLLCVFFIFYALIQKFSQNFSTAWHIYFFVRVNSWSSFCYQILPFFFSCNICHAPPCGSLYYDLWIDMINFKLIVKGYCVEWPVDLCPGVCYF
jgi:hypothetical protein